MVRPGRDRLSGMVEVDETYWGAQEEGIIGRLTEDKALILVATQHDGSHKIGRIRMRCIPDLTQAPEDPARPTPHDQQSSNPQKQKRRGPASQAPANTQA